MAVHHRSIDMAPSDERESKLSRKVAAANSPDAKATRVTHLFIAN